MGENVHARIGRHMLADGMDLVFDNVKSQGCRVRDARSGRDYLDLFSCFASVPVGYNHPKMLTPEFIEQLGRVAVNKISLSDLYSEDLARFVETFARVVKPDAFKYLFFVEGGALAVENALKTAMDWKVRLNRKRGGTRGKGTKILHFKESFHGRSGYTMSLTNTDPTKTDLFAKFDWPRVHNPKILFPLDDHLDQVIASEAQALSQIEQIVAIEGNDIAAIIIEPIQGEGGDNHFRDEFMVGLRRICDDHDLLLIFDEVQTGIGLTGKMWCFEHFSVVPDIISFGKKTQVCGIMATDRLDQVDDHVFRVSSRINSTWGGNIVDMVRFTRVMEIIEQDQLVEHVRDLGPVLLDMLRDLRREFPHLVSQVRGRGLFAAFDLPNGETRDRLVKRIVENGALILSCGWQSVRFRPSLTVSEAELREGVDIIRKSLREL